MHKKLCAINICYMLYPRIYFLYQTRNTLSLHEVLFIRKHLCEHSTISTNNILII